MSEERRKGDPFRKLDRMFHSDKNITVKLMTAEEYADHLVLGIEEFDDTGNAVIIDAGDYTMVRSDPSKVAKPKEETE